MVIVINGVRLRLRRKPGKLPWQLVEHSFRQYRDRRVKITLPKVSCLEEDDQQKSEASECLENSLWRT